MKKILSILIFIICFSHAFATHLKGGWMYYEYLGPGISNPAKLRYKLVLKQYMTCGATNLQIGNLVNFSIFNGGNNSFIENVSVLKTSEENIQNHPFNPCIQNEPIICYKIVTYEIIKELAPSPNGYIISKQQCCRISGINNIDNSQNVGATYMVQIPGTTIGFNAEKNSSALFAQKDTVVVCGNNYFEFPFDCTDVNGDSLTYTFCDAYTGASISNAQPQTASTPPYTSVPYLLPFSGTQPLGNQVSINPATGLVSGIAPAAGVYVITVCCSEYRNGIKINEVRKELHISAADCIPLKARLDNQYIMCKGLTLSFSNRVFIDPNATYTWDFGDPASGINNNSSLSTPSHTFTDSGTYIVKLKVSLGSLCADSTTAIVKVYPGFTAGFSNPDFVCKGTVIQFTDTSTIKYGFINSWTWDFGNPNTANNTNTIQNPTYTFTNTGQYNVSLIISNSKGCIDTVYEKVTVLDNPSLTVSPKDTIHCILDKLKLTATGNGSIVWTPNYNIDDVNSFNPIVNPDISTTYFARLTDLFGCYTDDSVIVTVKNVVTINAGNDTTICQTDGFVINTIGDALHYQWTPATGLNSAVTKNPLATPLHTTLYHITGNTGSCKADDEILITVIPYPAADAGADTSICFGNNAQLNATGGSIYTWAPNTFLSNANISNPTVIKPTTDMQYTVTVKDILGCPKPVKDIVVVKVVNIIANAGPSDTSIVEGQSLQLQATGGLNYLWSPDTWLNNPTIATPIALPQADIEYKLLVKSEEGCESRDTIRIKLYKVKPDLYVPNAFTPNGDGLNDIIRPILLGMKELKSFRVYNRWGQLVFSTTTERKGWDGTLAGKPQESGTYVWMAEGVTYNGITRQQKGYLLLIR